MPRDTELPWYDSLCHDQKSEENLLKRYGQRIDKILLFMDTLCSYLCTSPMMQWWWAFFIRLKYDDDAPQLLFKIGHEIV